MVKNACNQGLQQNREKCKTTFTEKEIEMIRSLPIRNGQLVRNKQKTENGIENNLWQG